MTELPILFSAPMVRAILDGSKTQTRRVMTNHPGDDWVHDGFGRITSKHPKRGRFGLFVRRGLGTDFPELDIVPSRYGQPGDRLWVREAHSVRVRPEDSPDGLARVWYRASSPWSEDDRVVWSPSIHMHRWASRITLEITRVRVERLQDISEADCIAEGCAGGHGSIPGYAYAATPLEHYNWLWNHINGPGEWEANPWVWVIEFKKV